MSLRPSASLPDQRLVVIGNFDGVHRGHRAVLTQASQEARRRGLVPTVLTFEPHPAVVLGRGAPAMLTTLEQKRQLLHDFDASLELLVHEFTLELAALTPAQFAEDVLARELDARVVVVGQNFRFGRGRIGDLGTLQQLGEKLGFEVRSEALQTDDGGALSSTRIRQALAAGDVDTAHRLLGRPYAIRGQVVHGDQRGASLGFPTANLGAVPTVLPADGVYAGMALLDDGGSWPAVVNIGARPTVQRPHAVEAHLLDMTQDLYGRLLTVRLVHRLRETAQFPSLEALVEQIGADVAEARRRLSAVGP